MRFVHVGVEKKSLVGGNQRQVVLIGQINEILFGLMLALKTDTHDFNIQRIGKKRLKPEQKIFGFVFAVFQQQTADRTLDAAGQGNQPGTAPFKVRKLQLRLFVILRIIKIRKLHQLHDIMITFIIANQKHKLVRFNGAPF